MDFRELFLIQHARAHVAEVGSPDMSLLDNLLKDVTDEQLRKRPDGFNSLAWLLWHMTRAEDIGINAIIAERPQVLDEGRWVERLYVPRHDLGSGMTAEEVDELDRQIDSSALLAYRAAVGRRTQEVIRDLRPEALEEVIGGDLIQRLREAGTFGPNAEWVAQRWEGKRKTYTLTHSVLSHAFMHIGEGQVVRGLLGFRIL